ACNTVRRRPISGTEIDYEKVTQIEPDQTTKTEVEEWFGPAERTIRNDDGSEEARYRYVGFIDRKTEALVYMRNQTEKENQLLRLTLRGGVVTGLEYTDSLQPDRNLKKP
ncbi:MAG: hypothetical protein ACREQJ_03480, partial [Candidatus Binatia bacterium]